MERLNRTGDNAGAVKCFSEFNTPIPRATRHIKKRKGNIHLVKETVSGSLCWTVAKPGAVISTISFENMIPAIVSKPSTMVKNVNAVETNLLALSLEPRVSASVNTGKGQIGRAHV